MSKGAINFSSDNEYYTPKQIVKMFSEGFEYDPASVFLAPVMEADDGREA